MRLRRHTLTASSWAAHGALSILMPPHKLGSSSPNLPAFEAELATALTRADGSIGKLKIEFIRARHGHRGWDIYWPECSLRHL